MEAILKKRSENIKQTKKRYSLINQCIHLRCDPCYKNIINNYLSNSSTVKACPQRSASKNVERKQRYLEHGTEG